MYKGQKTRENILREAFTTFNSKGYEASSMSDLMSATGLTKGGIYNHFGSKDDLAVAAFTYAFEQISTRMLEQISKAKTASEKLLTVIEHFESMGHGNSLFAAGCPLMNAAIESDCANPVLQEHCHQAFARFIGLVESFFKELNTERKTENNPHDSALFFISTLEGALMLSQISRSRAPLKIAAENLIAFHKLSKAT